MAGSAIGTDDPIREPKAGDWVRTETGVEGTIVSNTSHILGTNSCAITVRLDSTASPEGSDGPGHVEQASYEKVYNPERTHVPTIDDLAWKQNQENKAAVLFAAGLYSARQEIKLVNPRATITVPNLTDCGYESPISLPECCINPAHDKSSRHREIMAFACNGQYEKLALFIMEEQDQKQSENSVANHLKRSLSLNEAQEVAGRCVIENTLSQGYLRGERQDMDMTIVIPTEWQCAPTGPIPYMLKIPGIPDPLLPPNKRSRQRRTMGAAARAYWGEQECEKKVATLVEYHTDAAVQWCQGGLTLHADGTVKASTVQKRKLFYRSATQRNGRRITVRCHPQTSRIDIPHAEVHARNQKAVEERKSAKEKQRRLEFFAAEGMDKLSDDELRQRLRESKLFPPIEITRIIFLKQFLDGRDTDQYLKGGTGASKTHQIIAQIMAKGINSEGPYMVLLLTGKRVQATNSFQMAMEQAKAEAIASGSPEPREGDLSVALGMGNGSFKGCKEDSSKLSTMGSIASSLMRYTNKTDSPKKRR